MEKIETLTKEQEEKIPIYLQKYYDRVYKGLKIDKSKAEKSIKNIYTNAGYKEPIIWYCQSPWQAQIVINLLKESNLGSNIESNLRSNLGSNLESNLKSNLRYNLAFNLWSNLESNLRSNLEFNLRSNLDSNLRSNIESNLESNLKSNLKSNLRSNIGNFKWEQFSYYGNISDHGWTCFYDFINHELIPKYKNKIWDNWLNLIDSNIYDMIQMDGLCIVVEMPTKVSVNENRRLHSPDSLAVEFSDGYTVYAWNGIILDEKYILQKDSITKEDITKETNAEKRRCLQEILGSKKYAELLNIEIIDEDIDQYGYSIKLWRTKEPDTLINQYIYFLNVICNSTQREYYLCVPKCKNVWEAKSWTFNNEKIEIRHGDIGLKNIEKEFNQPIIES